MSHLTDEARAAFRDAQPKITTGEDSLESIVAANPARRTILKNGLLGLSMLPMLGALTACGDDDASASPTPTPTPPHTDTDSCGQLCHQFRVGCDQQQRHRHRPCGLHH